MLALLISLTLSANIWTYTRTSYEGQKCYQLNIAEFEKVLLSTQDTGAEFRIQLIDYNQELSYYKLKPIKMFAKEVRDKYPNEHYAFTGYKEGKPSEIIGLVWCFKVLKQFWMILPATIEIKKTITEYVLFNPDYLATRKLNEIDNFNSTINHILNQVDEVTAEFKHHLHDADSEGESIEQRQLHLVPLTKRMDHIKIIRFVPFPTVEYNRVQQTLRGSMLDFSPDDQKKVIFSQLAASVLFANMILLPQCSVRLEMLFYTDLIFFQVSDKSKYLKNTNYDFSAEGDLQYEGLKELVLKYFRDDRVDLAHFIHCKMNQGLSVVRGVTRSDSKWQGFTSDATFGYHGRFELAFVHEIGHQIGAHHPFTFKPNGGFYATEVGSGVSIMAYPGRSNGDDVQPTNYPYYNIQNLDEITRFLATAYHVNTEPKEDQPPVIDDMKRLYYIPKSTAFLLQGSAHDNDDPVLYYHWETIDEYAGVVTRKTFGSTRTKGPIMRDYDVTTDNFRYIPKLERILAGKILEEAPPTDWETVPSVARTLNFAFVVRDKQYYSGEPGYVTFDTVTLQVTDDGPFKITSLSSASSFRRGSKTTIQWDVAGTNAGSINAQKVTIKFSPDRGQTWQDLHSNVDNTGSYEITFPNVATTQGRIMIKPDDNVFLTINTADITLT